MTESSVRVKSESLTDTGKVLNASYNFHGTKLATCNSTGIQIWEEKEARGSWQCTAVIQNKSSTGYRHVAWAHPEFGPIIAASGEEVSGPVVLRQVYVWEEELPGKDGGVGGEAQWRVKAVLSDSGEAVGCLQFAPPLRGLLVAAGGEGGCVRVYECLDPLDHDQWELQSSFYTNGRSAVSAIEWSTSKLLPPILAVAVRDTTKGTPEVQLWSYSAPLMTWQLGASLEGGAGERVVSLAWGDVGGEQEPPLLLAAGCGRTVTIWQLTWKGEGGRENCVGVLGKSDLTQPDEVCQVSWNLTCSTLAVSLANGTVHLWSPNLASGEWQRVADIVGRH